MDRTGPRIILIGGTYRALCVLERLMERGERVVAFIGQEGGGERDFCPEILEICDRYSIPARSAHKLGEEIVRWLEDRIRPDLAIAVGTSMEIPIAIGGNTRLGLIEVTDFFSNETCPGVVLRQRGQDVLVREVPPPGEHVDGGDAYLHLVEEIVAALDEYLDGLPDAAAATRVWVPFDAPSGRTGVLTRTSAAPACRRRSAWAAVAETSCVCVAHMLCTEMSAPPPICTGPACTARVGLRGKSATPLG